MHLIISTSLNPNSRSRILAGTAARAFEADNQPCDVIDLAELKLPQCDGGQCFADETVQNITGSIASANSILIAAPIYNYDVSASCKNLIELTGKAWTDKVVGFLLAAGGQGSFMGVMGLANSLMLDFRSLIVPRFVYATGEAFSGNELSEPDVTDRIHELVQTTTRLGKALNPDSEIA